MKRSMQYLLCTVAALPLAAVPVSAQTVASTDAPAQASTSTDTAATAAATPSAQQNAAPPPSPDAIGDIVVTAQRREERLQNVPAAISAFTGEQLRTMGIVSTKDLTRITAGLNMTQSFGWAQPTIRGVGTRGVGAGDEAIVPTYIDGVYQPFIQALFNDLNSIERIEVLKGPQGALFGRNATGGAINIITRTPGNGTRGDVSLRYGNYNDVVAKAYLSVGNDTFGADIAAVYSRADGYIYDDARGKSFGGRDNYAIRSKVVWHPSSQIDLTLAGSIGRNSDSAGESLTPVNGNTIGARIPGNVIESRDFNVALTFSPYLKAVQRSISLTGQYHGTGFDITALSGYQFNRSEYLVDSDSTPADIGTSDLQQYSRSYYNEAYLSTDAGKPISFIIGGVYYHNEAGYSKLYSSSRSVSLTGVLGTPSIVNTKPGNSTDSYAAYLQAAYHITDQLTAIVAGRYTVDVRDFESILPSGLKLTNHNVVHKFTPTGTLQFQPSPTLNIYAKAGQAFKAGIVNNGGQTADTVNFTKPETLTQYEIGIKTDLSRTVRVNLAGYLTNYDDLQVSARDPVNPGLIRLQNAGGAQIYGLELETFIRPVDKLNVQASASLLHAVYRDYPGAQAFLRNTVVTPANLCTTGTGGFTGGNRSAICDASGKNLIRTPFVQLNLSANYTIPLASGTSFLLSGGLSYQGHSYWDTYNLLREPAYTLADARVTYRFGPGGHYEAAIWGSNLLDERYNITTSVSATNSAQERGRPRTYGIELRASF